MKYKFGDAPIKREGGSYVPFPTKNHFTCELCYCMFERTSLHDHAGDTDEETVSLCDSCYAKFLEKAAENGHKINDIGGLENK